jgi:AcrR family transcriptional regulator
MRSPSRLPATVPAPGPDQGVRARTYRRLLTHAMSMAKGGRLGSVAEVAAAAGVSRATAYRYFPSRSQLVSSIVEESLGPVRRFRSSAQDGRTRLQELFEETFPRFREFEPHMRAALQLALEHWARERAGTLDEQPYRRGHRAHILANAAAPLRQQIGSAGFARLIRALSLIYGIESYVVLKDIWGATDRQVQAIARWAADALVVAALADARSGKDRRTTGAHAVASPGVRGGSAQRSGVSIERTSTATSK